MKLKRKNARFLTVWTAVTLGLCLLLGVLGYADVPMYVPIVLACVISAMVILLPVLRLWLLACPVCGKTAARPYWNLGPGHEQFCPKCGHRFIYDDEK